MESEEVQVHSETVTHSNDELRCCCFTSAEVYSESDGATFEPQRTTEQRQGPEASLGTSQEHNVPQSCTNNKSETNKPRAVPD